MTTRLVYRFATPADVPAICLLGREVNDLHHVAMPFLFAPLADPLQARSVWEECVGKPDATTVVADHRGTLVGFVTLKVLDETSPLLQPVRHVRIGSVAVTERFRGRGIGHALMREAETWARAQGATDLRLGVAAFNEGAARLYETLGYAVRLRSMGKSLD